MADIMGPGWPLFPDSTNVQSEHQHLMQHAQLQRGITSQGLLAS